MLKQGKKKRVADFARLACLSCRLLRDLDWRGIPCGASAQGGNRDPPTARLLWLYTTFFFSLAAKVLFL